KCPSTSSSSSSSSSGSSSPSTSSSSPGPDSVCEFEGLLGSNGFDVGGPDETIADQLVDAGIPLNEPEVNPGGGAISEPLYDTVSPLTNPILPGAAAEVACIVNLLTL